MPWVLWVAAGLIGYRATVQAGDEMAEAAKSAVPYVAAGVAAYLIIKRVM